MACKKTASSKGKVCIDSMIKELQELKYNMHNKDLLLTWEKEKPDILAIIKTANILREMYKQNYSLKSFNSGLAVSFFRDNSTRTRMAYSSACDVLGLLHQEMDEKKSQLYHGETTRETANMISFLTESIGVRDDMYIGKGHKFMTEVAQSLDEGYKEGVLFQRPALVNLQCDLDHPTQTLADLAHLNEYYGGLENLKGKKFVISWAYSPSYGKPLSVPQGLIGLLTRFGMDVTLAHPEGYDLIKDVVDVSGKFAKKEKGSFKVTGDMNEAFKGADIVYPKSWAPYWVMEKRTKLVEQNDEKGLKDLEKQCLENNKKHMDWICDEEKMKLTNKGKALYMHCLPADINDVSCKNGEVTKGVFEKYRVETYKEASFKPFIIAASVLLCRFADTPGHLNHLLKQKEPRAGFTKI